MPDKSLDLEQPQDEIAPEVSMEDTIRETYRKLQDSDTPERSRDERGRFANTQAPENTENATEAQETTVEAIPPKKAPSSWRKEAQELYGKLPQEFQLLQEEVERREADFHKGIESYKSKAQFADAMERVISPHMQTLQSLGVTPDVAVHHLLEADRVLRYSQPDQKLAYLQQLARSYGIDLGQQPEGEPSYQPSTDPRVDAVINYLRQQEAMRQQQEVAQLNSELFTFAKDKPHFEAVRNHMAGLLQAGVAKSLQDAYDMAIYASPEIRTQVLAQQQAEGEAKRAQEAKAQAEAARRASSVNVPRRGNLNPVKSKGSMEDTIRAEAQRLGLL